jgi:epoxyqueuosine reductase
MQSSKWIKWVLFFALLLVFPLLIELRQRIWFFHPLDERKHRDNLAVFLGVELGIAAGQHGSRDKQKCGRGRLQNPFLKGSDHGAFSRLRIKCGRSVYNNPMPDPVLTTELKAAARRLGFELSGVCPAVSPEGIGHFQQWLSAGYAGEMEYLPARADAYTHPRHVLDGVRSILMLAINYRTVEPAPPQPAAGRVSRYAWGTDYHTLVRERLRELADFLRGKAPTARVRTVVDTAPLLERELAQLAGLGWIGKNTLLLNKHAGSWFFLSALLTDLELDYDQPHAADHCGTCRACLDACPTDAFVDAYVLDARKCISYLTIESRQPIPHALRGPIGDWLFGCDICQEVCPWNHRAPLADEERFEPLSGQTILDLTELFDLDEAAFRARFRHTPLWRPKRRGLLRNAAIVLGNQIAPGAENALIRGLNDEESLVRGASAWALGRYENGAARSALIDRMECETDCDVQGEIELALECVARVSPRHSDNPRPYGRGSPK